LLRRCCEILLLAPGLAGHGGKDENSQQSQEDACDHGRVEI